jgi:hypothetical protein
MASVRCTQVSDNERELEGSRPDSVATTRGYHELFVNADNSGALVEPSLSGVDVRNPGDFKTEIVRRGRQDQRQFRKVGAACALTKVPS